MPDRPERTADQVVGQPVQPGFDVRAIAPEQLEEIGDHLLARGQRRGDLGRLEDRRREARGQLGVGIEPGHAGRLAEIVGEALESVHAPALPLPQRPRHGPRAGA